MVKQYAFIVCTKEGVFNCLDPCLLRNWTYWRDRGKGEACRSQIKKEIEWTSTGLISAKSCLFVLLSFSLLPTFSLISSIKFHSNCPTTDTKKRAVSQGWGGIGNIGLELFSRHKGVRRERMNVLMIIALSLSPSDASLIISYWTRNRKKNHPQIYCRPNTQKLKLK